MQVSTYSLAEQASSKLNGKVSVETIMLVWTNIGFFIQTQLSQGKGVKLNSFGTFTFTADNALHFALSNELANKCKSRQPLAKISNIPIINVNYAQVAADSNGISRESVDKIYTNFINTLLQCVAEGRNIEITMRGLIDISIRDNVLQYSFASDFMNSLNSPKNNLSQFDQSQRAILNKTLSKNANGNSVNLTNNNQIQNKNLINRNPINGNISNIPQNNGVGRRSSFSSTSNRPNSQQQGSTNLYESKDTNDMNNNNINRRGAKGNNQQGHRSSSGMQDVFSRNQSNVGHSNTGENESNNTNTHSTSTLQLVQKLKDKIVQRGGVNGIKSVARLLSIMDDNGDKRISKEELKYGLKDYGIEMPPNDLDQLFAYFDRDRNGSIDLTEFLVGLRGELNDRRRKLIRMAFNCLDKDKSGEVSADELAGAYDFTQHPEVRAGKKTIREALKEFMAQWDRLTPDGIVTIEEFEDYYKEISASIDRDDYFELMIRNAWRIAGGEGMSANTANLRVLVTNKDGSQSVQTVENELGLRQGDKEGIRSRLAKQGIDMSGGNVDLYGGMDSRPKGSQFQARPANTNMNANQNRIPPSVPQLKTSGRGGAVGGNNMNTNTQQLQLQQQQQQPSSYQQSPRIRQQQQRPSSSSSQPLISQSQAFDPYTTLHKLLYEPRRSLEQLAGRLSVSIVTNNPRITEAAFLTKLASFDPSLDRSKLQTIWKVIDPKNLKSIGLEDLHSILSSHFGKDKESLKSGTGSSVIERCKAKILERCSVNGGIKGLARSLAIMDNNGNKRLTKDELNYGLRDYGVELNIRELDEIFNYFDRDRSGDVDFTEFLVGVRGDMNDRRKKFVRMAFNCLDTDGSGEVVAEEVMRLYDVRHHPDVKNGQKTPQEVITEFMAQWDNKNKADRDGIITYPEFEDYYKEISASIDGDDYFELMIRNSWRIAGGEGMSANTANLRVLVTNKDGSQSVQTVENELGLRQGDKEGIRSRLAKQGIEMSGGNVDLYGGMDSRPKGSQFQSRPGAAAAVRRPSSVSSSARRGNSSSNNVTSHGQITNNRGGGGAGLTGTSNNSNTMTSQQIAANNIGGGRKSSIFIKNVAASKLAAVFRGRLARVEVAHERRKQGAEQRQMNEQQLEADRPKPRQIARPQPKRSYIGF